MNKDILSFVCCLDKEDITLDYMSEFQGVRLNSFNRDELNENSKAVSTFTIDIKGSEFYNRKSQKGNLYVQWHLKNFTTGDCYMLLKFKHSANGEGYYYKNYHSPEENKETQAFQVIKILSIAFVYPSNQLVNKNNLIQNFLNQNNTRHQNKIDRDMNGALYLNSYSVGQGMCSLIHNGTEGVLLDCGAGKPILKPNYKNLSTNQLINDLKVLSQVDMILSHLDSDHHRLLSWDSDLFGMISNIYIPSNTNDLFLKDKLTHQKIIACSLIKIKFTNGFMNSYRTRPASNSQEKNDNALVTHIRTGKEEVLVPGDYLYKYIWTDLCPNIANLTRCNYTYIIVPHHGDKESSKLILSPSNLIKPIAFFSAGTHDTWKHPSFESLDAHSTLLFINVVDNENEEIDKICFNL
ncbi:hypothetical protein [Cedecea neteri]|uniref:Metallo-beta-lactamase domain-containing protein n=1 Tax=Cedecea neteri TaxID=158822 RepID=A0A291E162_9ENTR|nr:hypothetical protein [Cedecea neteri]ATF93797.1 hypothetical protein CO704_17655 [Cedecea neteri]